VTTVNNIWLKRISAAFFLLAIIAVTTIQVSHIHLPGLPSTGKHTKPGLAACDNISSGSNCFICDYQLTKNADNSFAVFTFNHPTPLHNTPIVFYTFTSQSIFPVFETRGPPAA
jgi:hypothetical protein